MSLTKYVKDALYVPWYIIPKPESPEIPEIPSKPEIPDKLKSVL